MDTYFKTTSYALVITAFLALALTGELDWISIALYSAAVVASLYRDVRKSEARGMKRSRWRMWLWRAGAFAYVPFLFVDAMVVSNRILALTHLTLFASAVKLYQHKRDRDWVFLYLIAFFQMLLAAGLTFNATFVASLITFLFFFISSLAAFEIRRARRELASSEEEIIAPIKPAQRKYKASDAALAPANGGRKRVRYLVGATVGQLAMIALLTLPFFFMIPRFGGGGVARGFGDTPATGFSDKVELGQVARIKKSQQVVMRVELSPMPNRYLRWRGIALEKYNGSMWSVPDNDPVDRLKTQSQGRNTVGDGSAGDSRFDRRYDLSNTTEQPQPQTEQQRPSVIEQKIILEPLDTPTLFAARKPFRIAGPLPSITKDYYTDALTANRLRGRTAYTVWSDVAVPNEQELKADSPALAFENIKRINLQLPKIDPRIRELAHEITRNAPTAYDKAKEIENFLKTKFGYTLNLKINSNDPLAEFLFDVREGHCEYFATAMVVMLRALKIPARIVNGFQMGEYNDINRLFIVRESDAHSWVEVYFPRTNSWVEFDPTPPAGINDYSQGGMFARLRKYMDAMEVFWLDYIVTLDSEEQASIMSSIQQKLLAVKDRLIAYYLAAKQWTRKTLGFVTARDWSAGDWIKIGIALGLLLAMGAALYVAKHIKRWSIAPTGYGPWWHRLFILPTWRSRRLVRRDKRESAVMFYEQMLAIASRAGLVKQPSQTPREFAAVSGFNEIREITLFYNRVRFGGAPLDEREARQVTNLLVELKHSIRRKQ